MIKTLLKSLRDCKKPAILTMIFMVGEAIIESIIPYITATYLINEIQVQGKNMDIHVIIRIGLILCGLAVVSLLCGGLAGMTSARASAGFTRNLRGDIFRKVQTYTFHNIDNFTSSSLVTRMTTDVFNIQMSFMMIIRIAVRSPLMLIFSCVMAAIMGGVLAATFVVIIPILVFGLLLISKKAMPAFHRVFKKYDKLNESIEENVQAMRAVKGFSREEYEKEKFGKATDGIAKEFTYAERVVALNSPIMNLCMYLNMVIVLVLGAYLAIKVPSSSVNIGHISAMLTYGVAILMSLMMLSMVYVTITLSIESAKRVCEVLNENPDIVEKANAETEMKDGSISFKNVNFRYAKDGNTFALMDVNLDIPSGATVGILGGTGSSKSSLVQLIPRLYDATEGEVIVGGVNVKDYKINALRDNVAMVLQKNLLFAGTIKENLRWGNPDATDEEIVEACKLACADEFIETFPNKYDTYIEQGGSNVSGGQKQRLCIARALLKKPKILILDDSTSAVDMKTDAIIRAGFKSYIPETTKIIIAQRVASVQESDMILIMDNGKIVDIGTHEELLSKSEIYREIYEQQTKGEE